MYEKQPIEEVTKESLFAKAQKLKDEGYRIVQMSCVEQADYFYIDYTFDKECIFHNLRLKLPKENPEIESLSGIFLAAFLYENEIHDLFGIKVRNMAIDYGGNFYRIKEKMPFRTENINVEKGD